MPLSRDEIAVLNFDQLTTAYEQAKLELDSLLSLVETDNKKKVELAESIKDARKSYILLRSRAYPKHLFHHSEISTADQLPAK